MNASLSKSSLLGFAVGAAVAVGLGVLMGQGQPGGGLVSQTEVLLRIERQLADTNARMAAIETRLSKELPVRIVEPLPAGLHAPAPSAPRGDQPNARPATQVPGPEAPLQQPTQTRPSGPLLAAAQKVYSLLTEGRAKIGEAPAGPEESYTWSRRWMEAQGGADAAKAHLERMRALESNVKARLDARETTTASVEAARYYRIEAEDLAAVAK